MGKLINRLRRVYLIDVFFSLKGNPKACIWLEPLWGIPYHLYIPYASLYMAAMGLDAADIGLIMSIYYVSQAVSSVLSGVLTDKLGRRKCTLIFDTLSWSVPDLLWMLSGNVYWFAAAALFNGMWRITDNSWGLLLIEDAERDHIMPMYSLTSVMGLIAAFAAPLSSLAVKSFGMVPTMRFLYGFTCVSMTTKFVTLYKLSRETSVGLRRMEKTRGKSIFTSLWECRYVFVSIIKEKRMVLTIAIMACFSLVNALNDNYFALYMNQLLNVGDEYMALFTTLKSLVRLGCMFLFASRVSTERIRNPMIFAWSLFILGQLTLLLNPGGAYSIPLAFLQVSLEAAALSILYPATSSLLFINADREERARVNGLVFAVIALVTAVFPALVGYIAQIDLRAPFIVNICMYILAITLTIQIAKLPAKREEDA